MAHEFARAGGAALLALSLSDAAPASAHPSSDGSDGPEPSEVTVTGERPAPEAASRVRVSRRELEQRPRRRPADLFEAVPGMFSVQHAGGGKATQWFVRGFDADHGTDVALFVDGVPVNLTSHGHGQGYADVHFVIPELVTTLDGYKGPYDARFGNFATAGAVNLTLADTLAESRAEVGFGAYGQHRGLFLAAPDLGGRSHALLAAEVFEGDGPFVHPERLRRYNLFARATHHLDAGSSVALTLMSHGSSWNGSGQIPARAVCGENEAGHPQPETSGASCVDHFGAIDPSEGGGTQRHQASLRLATLAPGSELSLLAYLVRYRFGLFSNFTFFAEDPARGDAIEQTDDRTFAGTDARLSRRFAYGPLRLKATLGLQARFDGIDNTLWHSAARERLEPRVRAAVTETALGMFGELDARVSRALRFVAGARADRIDVAVDDRNEELATPGTRTSGTKGTALFSPKLVAVLSPLDELDLFAAYGRGFHSNDARGAVLGRGAARLITPALGYEVGARAAPVPSLTLTAAAFLLDLDSELVWSGDAGTTEPSGRTRRYGLELGARYRLSGVLFADADLTLVRARYRDVPAGADAVPLVPTRTFSAGLAARPTFGDWTPFGSLRVRSIADRPAIEDGSFVADGFTTLDATAGARYRNVEAALDVLNVLDARYREVVFVNESRLAYEPAPVTGVHYSPGWPRTVMARAAVYWE